jgi:putative Mg2+ transporter-C (MgtC) family protein
MIFSMLIVLLWGCKYLKMELNTVLVVKLLLAVLLGGAIGVERELRSKSAGFRTMILICLGATLFTIFSQILGSMNGSANPDRIASNVVVGIGFIGAGVIFRSNNRVTGITTAASMWLCAALGVGIGCGYFLLAAVGCALVLTTLFIFSFMDTFLDKLNQVRAYKIAYPYEQKNEHKYELLMTEFNLKIKSRTQNKTGNIITGDWIATGSEKKHLAFIEHILNDNAVTEFAF